MTDPDRSSSLLLWFGLGAGGAAVGLLPWLATGARLPLQNLGAAPETPFVLLPLNQYFLTTVVALLVVGPALAGIAARALARRRPRIGMLALVGGVLAVQLVAVVQSVVVTGGVLRDESASALYLALLVAVCVVSMLVGLLVLLLVARAPVPGAVIGLALAAIVAGSWLGAPFREPLITDPYGLGAIVLPVLRWTPAVLVGAAIAWGGLRSPGRVAAALVALAALWIGPTFFTAVSAAAGARVLARDPAEMLDYGLGVFAMAIGLVEALLPGIVVAAVIGVMGGVALDALRRRGRRTRAEDLESIHAS